MDSAASTTKLRAWRWHKQGLDGSLAGQTAAEVLTRTGWARSIGGAAPYLTLFARAGLRRTEIDAALANLEIHELPAVRGCTYVVPAADYSLALAAGAPFADDELKVARKLGVTDKEVAKLRAAVVKALADGPLEPEALRTKVGSAARNLGPEGAKKGLTTTLPVALGLLQSAGEIRRIPVNGRIDIQRYRYAAWKCEVPCAVNGSFTDLARRYFSWIGPISLAEFQTFSGLGVKAAKAAIEPLHLVDIGAGGLLLPEDHEAFVKFQAPKRPQYALVSSLDGIGSLGSGLESDEDSDLRGHAILDRGRLIGRWEFDTATGAIAWALFGGTADTALQKAIRTMEAFVRDDLGDARSFSLDSPKSRVPRIEALRKAAGA
jgi:Winged helix DNA-binding domain